ncbi:uncharacterized protein RB166_015763 isoform 2-T2 [Leptodactylus fuscus]|uniref:uncharacterized protein LOC142217577 isoform X2 n=1 Tax=Leptodactylus fuscus TaxID=238119 RepID=UPI003F4EE47D
MDNHQLRDRIRNFSLDGGPHGNQGYSRVVLQLFGYNGHGKYAFINSCKYAMGEGRFIDHADAGVRDGVMTMVRNSYDLTQNICIVDNRGCQKMNSFQRAEIYAQLGNFIPIGERVEWSDSFSGIMDRVENAELNRNYSDFIVPILVFRASHKLISDEKEELKTFMENCMKMTGVFPIVVVTFRNSGVVNDINIIFTNMGAKVISFIENYTRADHETTQGKTEDILMIIDKVLTDVTLCLNNERNPRQDWLKHKKFLQNYVHQADLEKEKKQWITEQEKKKNEQKNSWWKFWTWFG